MWKSVRTLYRKNFNSERVGTLYDIVACCDVDENKSNYVGSVFSCKSYISIEDFVKHKDMEVVVILTKVVNTISMQKYAYQMT